MARGSLAWVCLLPLLCCGPYTSSAGDEGPAAAAGADPAADGGSAPAQSGDTASAPDAGSASAQDAGGAPAQDGGSAPSILSVHDLHVEGIRASVLYANELKARQLRCDQIVVVKDSDLPDSGKEDYKGGVVAGDQIHAHNVDAEWIEVPTVYVRSLRSK